MWQSPKVFGNLQEMATPVCALTRNHICFRSVEL